MGLIIMKLDGVKLKECKGSPTCQIEVKDGKMMLTLLVL